MFDDENPIISLGFNEIAALEQNALQINVLAENLPEDLFGAAFHLSLNDGNFELTDYILGDVFGGKGIQPVMLAAKLDNEIVFGVTLKKGDQAEIRDGVLAVFNIIPQKKEEITAEFKDAVLSTFNGQRENIENVQWVPASYSFTGSGSEILQTSTFLDANVSGEEASMFTMLYISLLISIILILSTYFGFLLYRRYRKNTLT
jgi:hypothetical protein